jgi:hypothetical protein
VASAAAASMAAASMAAASTAAASSRRDANFSAVFVGVSRHCWLLGGKG